MPVTARLSRKFYERFGDEVTNELVEWFNAVDLTYRTDLRELNESNFARFDAKLEQRFAELEAKWERRFAELDAKWERRIADMDAKWERRFADMDAKWIERFAGLESRMESGFARQHQSLLRWMFALSLGMLGLFVQLALR
jgi:hypothetical protein